MCGALLVENGQKHRASAAFINQQWLWFNVAVMAASLLGGELIEFLSPAGALHAAAAIAAVAPIAVVVEQHRAGRRATRAGINVAELRRALRGFLDTFRSRTLWLIAAFLFCYYFSPGFGTPLYFHMTDHLRFSQGTIGMLSSVSAGGWIAGGLIYRYLLRGMTTRALLNLSILGGTLATLAFLGMVDETSAIAVYFLNGVAGMIANIATLTLAADHCPRALRGLRLRRADVGHQPGDAARRHDRRIPLPASVPRPLAPLIVVSAAFTAFDVRAGAIARLGDRADAGWPDAVKREQACAGRGTAHACSYDAVPTSGDR